MSTPSPHALHNAAETIKVCGHPHRLSMLHHLATPSIGEVTVTELYTVAGISQAVASQHLITLKDRGVLKSHKVGTKVFYSFASDLAKQVVQLVYKAGV